MPEGFTDFAQCLQKAITKQATIGGRNYQSEDGSMAADSVPSERGFIESVRQSGPNLS